MKLIATIATTGALCLSATLSIHTWAVCIATAEETTPTADFTVHNNGAVTHKPTGLMWQVCSQGQSWAAGTGCSTGTVTTHTWSAALAIPASINAGGGYAAYTDWRLPNIKELVSIAELRCYDPAINEAIFPDTPSSHYWSSSPDVGFSNTAWSVFFDNGNDLSSVRPTSYRVRLVRGGQ